MAYIRTLANGNYRADVRMKGIVKNKTFSSQSLAHAWADKIEHSIKTIANMETAQLLALSVAEIDSMGGADLFMKVGKRIRYKTFRDVCTEYLGKWNRKDYTGQMQRVDYWCKVFGDRIMTDIDIFDLREQIDCMVDEGQRATINRKKAVLSSVYKFALSRGYVDSNIVRNVVIDDDTKRRNRVLSDAERPRLLKACQESHWDKLYLLVLMAMTTGARRGELLKLRWCDISIKDSVAYLGNTKNGDDRELHFAPIVMDELKRFQEVGNGLIFPSAEKPTQAIDIRKAWEKALRVANIPAKDILNPDGSIKLEKFTFHCLRHGFCSALSDSGKELSQIGKLAGHKSLQTTMRYIHQGRDQKRLIVNELVHTFSL